MMQRPCQLLTKCGMLRSISDLRLHQRLEGPYRYSACGIDPSQLRDARPAHKGLSVLKVSLEHSGVRLSRPLMRSSSPPRWIQIILSQLAQLPLAVKNRCKTIQLTASGERHRACSNPALARQTQQSFGTLAILSVA